MIVNTNAIVLHRMKYKNSSLIARIFTENSGKMSIIINGANKRKDNISGIVEPPNIINLNYYKRKTGTLQTGKEANFLYNNSAIKNNIIQLSAALSIVEIIDKTFHENDVNSDVYNLACQTLKIINDDICDVKLILSFFLLNLIELLGFMIDLENEMNLPILINKEIKLFLIDLDKSSLNNLNDLNHEKNNLVEVITILEIYIKQHLKLNGDIQSLTLIKEIINE